MSTLSILTGDATVPATRPAVIVHVCNDIGGWGRGFVLALSARWRAPETAYRGWARGAGRPGDPVFALGSVQFVEVEPGLTVANLVGQRDVRTVGGVPPVRYEAIEAGLRHVGDWALEQGATVHMPRIGCGLAGGRWECIEPLVRTALVDRGVPVTVYDLPHR